MIVDLERFITSERPEWQRLEEILNRLDASPDQRMSLEETQQFHMLYERTSASLAKIATFSAEPETRRYLEHLVARAYSEIHETREKRRRLFPLKWFFQTLPQTFRRHIREFQFAVVVTLIGCALGVFLTVVDPGSREVTMPFGHDRMRPSERVHEEETSKNDRLAGNKTAFSASLMRNNIQVSINTLALGATYGIGTILMLFYNGVVLGAIGWDYIHDGQARFLMGWLLPHGVIEIPAILVAGQAGFIVALALVGWNRPATLASRLRECSRDVMTLAFGFSIMLVWAGLIEAFLSQYHEPIIPYEAKIAFGVVQLVLLSLYFSRSGR
jgi:uncharacterized membrane protein SpoIIM required for sporulation